MIPKQSLFELAKALEGLPVVGAVSGTPAARAGVRYGDVLISVNGRRTRTLQDYVEAKELLDGRMEIVLFRLGEERVIELTYDPPSQRPSAMSILAELATMRIAPVEGGGEGGGSS